MNCVENVFPLARGSGRYAVPNGNYVPDFMEALRYMERKVVEVMPESYLN